MRKNYILQFFDIQRAIRRNWIGVLGLTDAVGYPYIDPMRWERTPADAGTFFVQVT
jgi:hypothetical protein